MRTYKHLSCEERTMVQLSLEQGREMARHEQLCETTGIKVYFAGPHSPWQRGRNENTNGLLHQYMPKDTDLAVFSQPKLLHGWAFPVRSSHFQRGELMRFFPGTCNFGPWLSATVLDEDGLALTIDEFEAARVKAHRQQLDPAGYGSRRHTSLLAGRREIGWWLISRCRCGRPRN